MALSPPSCRKYALFNTVEACRMATHTLAIEGEVFVLLASMTQSEKGLKANGLDNGVAPGEELPHTAVKGGGFTVIIAPDGRALTEPVPVDWGASCTAIWILMKSTGQSSGWIQLVTIPDRTSLLGGEERYQASRCSR